MIKSIYFRCLLLILSSPLAYADFCAVNSFVIINNQSQPIFTATFEVDNFETCLAHVWKNIHLPLIGLNYDKTLIAYSLFEGSIPVKSVNLNNNSTLEEVSEYLK